MTLSECLSFCTEHLPLLDSRLIIRHVCNVADTDFIVNPKMPVSDAQFGQISEMVHKRRSGIPLAYITGTKGFRYSTFLTPPGVLVPRPDTEILVQSAVNTPFEGKTIRILDLCAGTGCIGISTALELAQKMPDLEVELHLSDLSPTAFDCFCQNAENLIHTDRIRVFTHKGNLFEPVENMVFDLILTNPPYIKTSVIPTLEKEVLAEPLLALDGGDDGLDIIRTIVARAPSRLVPGGRIFMETGYDQGKETSALMKVKGFTDIRIIKDYGGCDRVVTGTAPVVKNAR